MVLVWSDRCKAAWTLPRGEQAVEQGRVGYVEGRPEAMAKLRLGVQRM